MELKLRQTVKRVAVTALLGRQLVPLDLGAPLRGFPESRLSHTLNYELTVQLMLPWVLTVGLGCRGRIPELRPPGVDSYDARSTDSIPHCQTPSRVHRE